MDRHRIFWLCTIFVASLAGTPARADYVGGLNPAGDNFLALRSGPGSGYRMILPMGPGTYLTVIGRDGRWLNVQLQDGTRGWAYDAYIFGGAPPGGGFDGPPPDTGHSDMEQADMPLPEMPPTDLSQPGLVPPDYPATGVQQTNRATFGQDAADVPVDPMASNWITYRNDRFGTQIDYSAPMFRMLPPPENDDGRSFEARDGSARFIVFATHNVFDSTLDELIEEHLAGLGDDEKVTQQRKGDNWYLHSGFRGGDFFLRKVVLSDGGAVIHTFEISYAKSLKARLDPMAARMAQSLRTSAEAVESASTAPDADGVRSGGAATTVAKADTDGWKEHSFEGFTLKAPQDWTASVNGNTLVLRAPDDKRGLMVWWWFPDEPLLGYDDIVSNRKIKVAGKPALWIHSKIGDVETLSVTLDEGRADKKRLHFLFEATGGIRLGGGDRDFDRILDSLTIATASPDMKIKAGGDAPIGLPMPQSQAVAVPDAAPAEAGEDDGDTTADVAVADEERRAWVGRVSVEVPTGWQIKPDEGIAGGIVMSRPDGGAQIALSFWPRDLPMPSDDVASIDFTVVLGRPATVLELSQGRMVGRQIFFDEPRGGGARLTLAYRAFGEPLADGLPLFEMVLASLDETLAPPEGSEAEIAAPASGDDPFAGLDLSELEEDPK
ncbi:MULTISPECIES: SH3 domain-containing protein [Alphaproteobacteria]|uniref:SH3b domain-containing protein n=2 Tax=Alphaproteobacteria TaxID=28211 RepID=A0A512HE87_9HYPH|nr:MULTISPECIES: SH3 domain-containing protein [Alphaproteobacteria]GEO83757.1 hypothetical protein RNA01_06890 [Ciceribacter naphthalenivorans]GLR24091.1 hypothetical protein GCM10007920_38850 [Ciceribacter naphthalenivorans]GLT06947.1 hypothetical protein GCM10007926_38850 [Sphingomonas psychrolutea]